jgi:hypothetical protein
MASVQTKSTGGATDADWSRRWCVIGAGTSGLAVVKNFVEHGIAVDCYEREDDIGGNWNFGKPHSSVCQSTHLISSKRLTEYLDFPMPADYPEYPSHARVLDYLHSYADRFGLRRHIRFSTAIERVEPLASGGWLVTLGDTSQHRYAGVVVANGHNWDPRWPDFTGSFAGRVLHSSQYKSPEVLAGQRVLVVGAGNSGCDIAVESSQHAAQTFLSMRRGYHYLPKFFHGTPIDVVGERLLKARIPLGMRRLLATGMGWLVMGDPQSVGLPKPDHKLFETHPIINSQLVYHAAHGDIGIKPNIDRLDGQHVQFADGTREAIDVIVYATGFKITIPFIDASLLNWHRGRPDLFLNMMHPERDDLFVAGLIQPDSGQWGLVDRQARVMAAYIVGLDKKTSAASKLRQRKQTEQIDLARGIRYIDSPRHLLEVEHFSYARRLDHEYRRLVK